MAQRFNEDYRGLGVRKFYETKLEARKDHVRELRRRVEAELFDDWKNGVKSMHDLSRCVAALIAALEGRLLAVDDKISRAKSNIENAEHKVTANRDEWAKVWLLPQLFGKRRRLLDAHGEYLRELYTARTQAEAWTFAKRLMQESVTEFNRLATDIGLCSQLVDESIKEFKERIDERCNDTDKPDLRQSLVRFYHAENVRLFARDLEKDKEEQTRQSQAIRLALIEQIAADPSFAAFHNRLSRQRFFDVLEQKCALSSTTAHDTLVASNRERRPLFGVNIIDQLEREYSGKPDDLRKFIHDLVEHAGNYLEFDPQAILLGVGKVKVSQFLVILPGTGAHAGFSEALKTLFREQLRGGVPVEIIESDTKPNEITLLGITNLFPLRYAKATQFLKESYDRRINLSDKPDRIKLELHGEGDGSQFPELLLADERTQREQALPALLLAKVLELISVVTSPTTGNTELYLLGEDADGLPVRAKLGKTLPEVAETIDLEAVRRLEEATTVQLQSRQHLDQRAELQHKVRDELKQILGACRDDFEDPTYRRFETAARRAIQTLKIT
jgi:hypothetical protein